MSRMKRISHRKGLLHIETENGIINIYAGLTDLLGRPFDSIELIPDRYCGENKVIVRGSRYSRFIRLKTIKA